MNTNCGNLSPLPAAMKHFRTFTLNHDLLRSTSCKRNGSNSVLEKKKTISRNKRNSNLRYLSIYAKQSRAIKWHDHPARWRGRLRYLSVSLEFKLRILVSHSTSRLSSDIRDGWRSKAPATWGGKRREGTMDLLIFLICPRALALLAGIFGVTSGDFVVSMRAMKEVLLTSGRWERLRRDFFCLDFRSSLWCVSNEHLDSAWFNLWVQSWLMKNAPKLSQYYLYILLIFVEVYKNADYFIMTAIFLT